MTSLLSLEDVFFIRSLGTLRNDNGDGNENVRGFL